MKAMYLCDIKENINKIYNAKTQQTLRTHYTFFDKIVSKSELQGATDTECIFTTWGFPAFTSEEIKYYFPCLKAVFYAAGSVRYFAEPFLDENIKVISAWLANAVPVAEYTVSQIILANKGFYNAARMYKNTVGHKRAAAYCSAYPGNYNTNVGILGVGAIGSMVAEKLRHYHLNIYAYDPFLSDAQAQQLNVKKVGLKDVFENCQTISNHIANLPETEGLLNYALFSAMKKTGVLINTGRGAQVVEADLAKALKEVPTRSAVLDVTIQEPCEKNSPLYTLPNVFLTPHIAGSMGNECQHMGEHVMTDALHFADNEPLSYEVTKKMLKTMA